MAGSGDKSIWSRSLSLSEACGEAVARLLGASSPTKTPDPKDIAAARECTAIMCSEFGSRTIGEGPPPGLTLGDWDSSPLELALRLSPNESSVRWGIDADAITPAEDPSLDASLRRWDAGLRVAERLEARYGTNIRVLRRVWEVLRPCEGNGAQRIAYGAAVANGEPRFQFYAFGGPEFYERLRSVAPHLGTEEFSAKLWNLAGSDVGVYSGFELTEGEGRAKYYAVLKDFDPSRPALLRSLAQGYFPIDDVAELVQQVYGEQPMPRHSGGLQVCFHLRNGNVVATTLHLPCRPVDFDLMDDNVLTDGELRSRIVSVLERLRLPHEAYQRALRAYAAYDLDDEVGLHSYFSLIRDQKSLHATIYLSPRFFLRPFVLNAEV